MTEPANPFEATVQIGIMSDQRTNEAYLPKTPVQCDFVLQINTLPSGRLLELKVYSRPGESPHGRSPAALSLTAADEEVLLKHLDEISNATLPPPPAG